MRLFMLSTSIVKSPRVATFRDQLRRVAPALKWVNAETFHVTLQFLGETKKLDEIKHSSRPSERPRR